MFKLTSRIDIAERGMDQIALSGVMDELYGERLSVHAVELLEIKLG